MTFPLHNINAPLGRVMLPVLSRLQDQPERYRRAYILAVRAIMMAAIPAVAVAASTSDRLIPFLLGERWSAAAPIFFWLSLAAFLQPLSSSTGWLFISSGRPGALLRWATFSTAIIVPALCVAVIWGAAAVAAAYFIAVAATTPLLFIYCVRGTSVRTSDLYAVWAPHIIASSLTWAVIHFLMADWPFIALLCVSLPLSYLLALAALWALPGGREAVRALRSLVSSTFASSRAGAWLRRGRAGSR
jgi:PST family polysaccharide transporter